MEGVPLPVEGRVWSISSPLQAGCGAKPQPPKDFMPSKDKSERFGNGSRDGLSNSSSSVSQEANSLCAQSSTLNIRKGLQLIHLVCWVPQPVGV